MEMRLEYNPNTMQTHVQINGVVDNTMYNPFFQVDGFPIQSWLKKRLAWSGLAETIKSVSRGSTIDFTFVGRKVDYRDVEQVLISNIASINLKHIAKYDTTDRDDIVSELQDIFLALPKQSPYVRDRIIRHISNTVEARLKEFPIVVNTQQEYIKFKDQIFSGHLPLYINEEIYKMQSSEIESIVGRNFIRPYDSIYIILNSATNKSYFLHQCELGMHVDTFCQTYSDKLNQKYLRNRSFWNDPASLEQWNHFIVELEELYSDISDEMRKIKKVSVRNTLTEDQEDALDTFVLWTKWYKKYHEKIMYIDSQIKNHQKCNVYSI